MYTTVIDWILHVIEILQYVVVFTFLGIVVVRLMNNVILSDVSNTERIEDLPYIVVMLEFVVIVVIMIVIFFIIKRVSELTPSLASLLKRDFAPGSHTMEAVVHISLGYVLFESSRSLEVHIDRLLH